MCAVYKSSLPYFSQCVISIQNSFPFSVNFLLYFFMNVQSLCYCSPHSVLFAGSWTVCCFVLHLVSSLTSTLWRWRHYNPLKGQELLTQWQSVTTQNTCIFLILIKLRFKCFELWHFVTAWVVPDVSKGHTAFLVNYIKFDIITQYPWVCQTHIQYFVLQNWMMKTLYLRPSCSSWRALTQHPHFYALSLTSWPHIQRYRNACRRKLTKHWKRMVESSHMRLSTAWSTLTWSCQVRRDLVRTDNEYILSFTFIPVGYFHIFSPCRGYIPSHASSHSGFPWHHDITHVHWQCLWNEFHICLYLPTVPPTVNHTEGNWCKYCSLVSLVNDHAEQFQWI